MEKKNNTGLVVLVIILIIMVLSLGGFIIYDKILKSNVNVNNEQTYKNDTCDTKYISDGQSVLLYDLTSDKEYFSVSLFYAIIKNGNLYYTFNENSTNFGDLANDYFVQNHDENDMKKYDGLTDVKRIKIFNTGTAINPTLYVITTNGKVYFGRIRNNNINLEEEKLLSDYFIEDIISQDGEQTLDYQVILKDGTKKEIKSQYEY